MSGHCPSREGKAHLAVEQHVQRPSGGRQPGALRTKLGECQALGLQVRSGLPSQEEPLLLLQQSGNRRDSTAFTEGVKRGNSTSQPLLSFPPLPVPSLRVRALNSAWLSKPQGAAPLGIMPAPARQEGVWVGAEGHWAGPPTGYQRAQPEVGRVDQRTCQTHELP